MSRRVIALVALLAAGRLADAADKAIGTFTVDGKTVRLTKVYATLERDPVQADQRYLMLLVSDVSIASADRAPQRLLTLAKTGKVHAIRIRWTYGTDSLVVSPYHQAIAESGRAFPQFATVNLTRLDERSVDAEFKAKMLGQTWFFNAITKAAVMTGGVASLEPDVESVGVSSAPGRTGDPNSTALKRQLGAMGYEFRPDAFFQAIGDHNPEAVELFLLAGMSPNIRNQQNRYALNHAVLGCGADADKASAVIVALVRGKGDVKTRDPDNQTTPLVGAVQSCTIDAVEALIKAGSDLSARSAGGATALQLADIFQRQDVAALLRSAGAK